MTRASPDQQGMALIEALIAAAILGIGLAGATQLTLKALNTASESRRHTVAQHLAQDAMDCLQAQARAGTALCPAQERLQVHGVTYTRESRSTPRAGGALTDLQVRVRWAASGWRASDASGTGSTAPADNLLEWHSSVSALPGWLGVSSP